MIRSVLCALAILAAAVVLQRAAMSGTGPAPEAEPREAA